MADELNRPSEGAKPLVRWAIAHMQWSDVSVDKNETTFALTLQDSDAARGQRLCVSGTIVQIDVQKTPAGKVNVGLLSDSKLNLYYYLNVGSSGKLVAQSKARLCGVVTGKHDYANSAGGQGHAVTVVGMFDVKENK